MDLTTVQRACLGVDGLFEAISGLPSFPSFRESFLTWMDDAHNVVITVLEHEDEGAIDTEVLGNISHRADITALQSLENLAHELQVSSEGGGQSSSSIADDRLSRLCIIIE